MIKDLIIDYQENTEISFPCVIRNMPNDVYHSFNALSTTAIKLLLECPAKYFYKYIVKQHIDANKPCYKIGKAVHCLLLEGKEKFQERYWVNPFWGLNKNQLIELCKEKLGYDNSIKKFLVNDLMTLLLENAQIKPKEEMLSNEEWYQLTDMISAIKCNNLANNIFLLDGESELSIFWEDKKTGLKFKCRPDFLPYDAENVPDYKTTSSVEPNEFYKNFLKYGYHIQAAMYSWGIAELTGAKPNNFYFIAQEKTAPYISQVFNPDKDLINVWGFNAIMKAAKIYITSMKKQKFESYCEHIISMSLDYAPEEVLNNFDKENGIVYAPPWIDKELTKFD